MSPGGVHACGSPWRRFTDLKCLLKHGRPGWMESHSLPKDQEVVHFHVMKLDGGFFLWVGSAPVLSNLAVSLNSKYDSTPLSTLVMGDPSDTTATSLAQRLAKRTEKQVFKVLLSGVEQRLAREGLSVSQALGEGLAPRLRQQQQADDAQQRAAGEDHVMQEVALLVVKLHDGGSEHPEAGARQDQAQTPTSAERKQTLGFGNFSLLGWSDGGITALIAAATNPELIKKMVVWGSNAFVSEEDLKLYNMVRDVSRWSARMRQPMEVYGSQVFAQTWEAWVDGITQFAKRPGGSICREQLPFISCPTLIVHGEKDPMVPSFHPQYLLEHIKGSRFHSMPEGKHNLHLRYADEFNKLVENFFEE
ncbi:Valacyclovir hydrolase [Oryzias melastigma]|uniref:Valacyclovir hydrolase n=1 Tax=Oryzias melastigma TaxID=30732 RepID=A0A834FHD6_ORYME|nr:Valacyclovir hydrolase [Oryzias melastigma]